MMHEPARSQQPAHAVGVLQGGIGEAVLRVEDGRFLTGNGRYVDDLQVPGMVHAYVVRSPHAHARIRSIGKDAALKAPGVLAVLTGDDVVRDDLGGIPCKAFPAVPLAGGTSYHCPAHPILAVGKARHVGDRIALVIAETLNQAKDAAELLAVEYEVLPAAMLERTLENGAPKVWDEASSNLCFRIERGESAAVDACFKSATHVTSLSFRHPRVSGNPIEPRVTIGHYDAFDGRYTLYSATQVPYRAKDIIATLVLKIPETSLRIVAPDVGGGFGTKGTTYPEEALVVWASRKVGRPVKWRGDRAESIASDIHGRDQIDEASIALDGEGRVLAMRASVVINVGAYLVYSAGVPGLNTATALTGVYDIPLVHVAVTGAFTHTSSVGPYRGAGRPEATFMMERLLDKAAHEMGFDPAGIRRCNFIPVSAMPYRSAGDHVYDSGDFGLVLERALVGADWAGFAMRRREAFGRNKLRGIGIGMHVESAGLHSERMEIRVEPNGSIAVHAGTLSTGQSHETMYSQMVSDWLGVPFAEVRVFQGDTDRVLFGRGSFAERTAMAGGSALRGACDEVVRKGKRIVAWAQQVPEADVAFDAGVFRVAKTNRSMTLAEVARKAYAPTGVPAELGVGLDGVGVYAGPASYPNGCMICEVDVDPDTGEVVIARFTAVDDVGNVINPITLEGQLHGSVAQGIGQALIEEVVFDQDNGQLLTASFMDYGMPRAHHMPTIDDELVVIPCTTNPLGVKGGSEPGNIAAPPAIANAIVDALWSIGVKDIPLPASSARIWSAIEAAKASR